MDIRKAFEGRVIDLEYKENGVVLLGNTYRYILEPFI